MSGDVLLESILSWIEKRELCAQQLIEQAEELESVRKNCTTSKAVGSTSCVVGGACLVGAGLATLLTGGAAGVLVGAGIVGSGLGLTVHVGTKITEHHLSSNIMKEAEQKVMRSGEIEQKIKQMLYKHKVKKEITGSFVKPDDLDPDFVDEFLTACMRRSGGNIKTETFNPDYIAVVMGVLAEVVFQMEGENIQLLLEKAAQKLIGGIAAIRMKNVLKGGATALGGAVVMAVSLPEAIKNWKDLMRGTHVTIASQSLRDTADSILWGTKELKEQLNSINVI